MRSNAYLMSRSMQDVGMQKLGGKNRRYVDTHAAGTRPIMVQKTDVKESKSRMDAGGYHRTEKTRNASQVVPEPRTPSAVHG
jgi:hypothetical protein